MGRCKYKCNRCKKYFLWKNSLLWHRVVDLGHFLRSTWGECSELKRKSFFTTLKFNNTIIESRVKNLMINIKTILITMIIMITIYLKSPGAYKRRQDRRGSTTYCLEDWRGQGGTVLQVNMIRWRWGWGWVWWKYPFPLYVSKIRGWWWTEDNDNDDEQWYWLPPTNQNQDAAQVRRWLQPRDGRWSHPNTYCCRGDDQ